MEWWHAVVLAVIQGLTEFLPVSSSGHLVLLPRFLGWSDQGLAFDVAVHVGTLLGVLVYFRRDLQPLATGAIAWLRGDRGNTYGRLAINLLVATIPVGLVGLLCNDFIETKLRSPAVVAFQLAVFGIVLWLADRFSKEARTETSLSLRDAVAIGCAQALALVPGTSRSGITMSAGRALGLTREAAARFAFLLAIPGIGLAGLYEAYLFTTSPLAYIAPREVMIGFVVAAVVGYACIHWFLRAIARIGFLPFTLYRLALAGAIVLTFYA
ncbi:MAG TPA: undecaprenyl-diphosphate phosphatase [Steroidobacteraceae bacterium]|nr:undecaprenyl-diphosphate phosphatase [Steroidobacteraceae bacterium]